MFKKRIKTEVVPADKYTDFSDCFVGDEKYVTLEHVAIGAGLIMYNKIQATYQSTTVPVSMTTQQLVIEPVIAQILSTIPVNAIAKPAGVIADKSFEMLATILDSVVQEMVAISFPIASVIMMSVLLLYVRE